MPTVRKQVRTGRKPRAKKGILDRLPDGWDLTETMSMLLYGRSGTGKTTFWSTFPGKILCMIVSGGKRPGELRSIKTPENMKRIKAVVVNDSEQIRELLEVAPQFDTIVLDHVTGLQDLILKEVLGLDELPAQKSWGLASQNQYGQCSQKCKEMLRAILSLEQHRVIIAQERVFENDGESEIVAPYVHAALTPSLVGWLGPACDYVANLFIRQKSVEKTIKLGKKTVKKMVRVKGVEYCMRTAPDATYTVKFRQLKKENPVDVVVDPTYQKIKALIEGK